MDTMHARLQELEGRSDLSGSVNSAISTLSGTFTSQLHGRYINRQVITTNGIYTSTTGTNAILVTMIGGGGGGGGAVGGAAAAVGAGGHSGVYWQKYITLASTSTTGSCTIGAAAAGGSIAGGFGNLGGDTTLIINSTTYTAKGGLGGAGMATSVADGAAAPGALSAGSSAGDIVFQGIATYSVLSNGGAVIWFSGHGGSTPLGSGGMSVSGQTVGNAGSGYGAGGSGAAAQATGQLGGASTKGVIIIDEYS
jgi:hypothetical protein